MPVFLLYLIKLSLGIAAVYCFYHLLLRRLTFYQFNRWYMILYPLLCFFIPFIDVAPLSAGSKGNTVFSYIPAVQQYISPVALDAAEATVLQNSASLFSWWAVAAGILLAGMLFFLIRLLVRLASLMRIKKQAVLIGNYETKLYNLQHNVLPFSFADSIYVNTESYSPDELQKIIRHEEVHVRQKHTFDIFLGELLCIINWYNPFAWLLRHAMRQNLEFIADNAVVNAGTDKRDYQYLLLKVTGVPIFAVANQLNFSSLKKRIAMMNSIQSAKAHLLKFAFVLPLAAVLLLAFRSPLTAISAPGPYKMIFAGIVYDDVTKMPVTGAIIKDSISGKEVVSDEKGYFEFVFPAKAGVNRMKNSIYKEGYHSHSTGCGTIIETNNKDVVAVLLESMLRKDNKGPGSYGVHIQEEGFNAAEPLYPQVQKYANEYHMAGEKIKNAANGTNKNPDNSAAALKDFLQKNPDIKSVSRTVVKDPGQLPADAITRVNINTGDEIIVVTYKNGRCVIYSIGISEEYDRFITDFDIYPGKLIPRKADVSNVVL